IRDLYVTGVQTCALPISLPARRLRLEPALDAFQPLSIAQAEIFVAHPLRAREQRIGKLDRREGQIAVERLEPLRRVARAVLQLRSEERRVGKGWGVGWRR